MAPRRWHARAVPSTSPPTCRTRALGRTADLRDIRVRCGGRPGRPARGAAAAARAAARDRGGPLLLRPQLRRHRQPLRDQERHRRRHAAPGDREAASDPDCRPPRARSDAMKTDEPRDDEILGRALSRAIETAPVDETPYDKSRIAMRPLGRGTSFWRVAALAATIVVAGALGSMFLDRPATDEPVAGQPSPTVAAARTPAATITPASTTSALPNAIDHGRIYLSRLDLPPVAFAVPINWPT